MSALPAAVRRRQNVLPWAARFCGAAGHRESHARAYEEGATLKHGRFSTVIDGALLGLVLLIAGLLIKREYGAGSERRMVGGRPEASSYSALVDSQSNIGHLSGSPDARVRFAILNDLECPFCAAFHQLLKQAQAKHGGRISLRFIHYPLKSHRFARPAALAAECAGQQGRFEPMIDLVFAMQDSLGLVGWRSLAQRAEISDLNEFDGCMTRGEGQFPDIDAGLSLGRSLGVPGTPAVYVNGWKMPYPPDSAEIEKIIDLVSKGRSPQL